MYLLKLCLHKKEMRKCKTKSAMFLVLLSDSGAEYLYIELPRNERYATFLNEYLYRILVVTDCGKIIYHLSQTRTKTRIGQPPIHHLNMTKPKIIQKRINPLSYNQLSCLQEITRQMSLIFLINEFSKQQTKIL